MYINNINEININNINNNVILVMCNVMCMYV